MLCVTFVLNISTPWRPFLIFYLIFSLFVFLPSFPGSAAATPAAFWPDAQLGFWLPRIRPWNQEGAAEGKPQSMRVARSLHLELSGV